MSTLLFAAVIFLGFQLFFGSQPPDVRPADKILEQLRTLNREIKDVSIAAELPRYESKINQEKLSQQEKDRKILEAVTLVTDTEWKAAKQRNDINRMTTAYMTIQARHKAFHEKPVWSESFPVAKHPDFPAEKISPKESYERIVRDLGEMNKTDKIVGLVPGYVVIDTLVAATGRQPGFSYAFAALLLAIVVRSLVWPFAQRQLMWSRQMSQLSPMLKELQEKYKSEPGQYQAKSMELYKTYGINPAAGCLPMLIQLPLFLLVYQCMVHYRFEFRNGTFLWINPSFAQGTHGWTAPNLGEMDYPLLVLYGISMVVTSMLTPVSDPTNAKQQRLLGIGVAVFVTIMMFFWPLPSAFVLYWIFTNIFSTIQSLRAYRMPLPPLVKQNAPGGGVFPQAPPNNGKPFNGAPGNGMFKNTGTPKVQKPKPKKKKK